jgi:hypothetical protein
MRLIAVEPFSIFGKGRLLNRRVEGDTGQVKGKADENHEKPILPGNADQITGESSERPT